MNPRAWHGGRIEVVRKELECWRAATRGRGRPPDWVWDSAVELARRLGVAEVAAALGLKAASLERRVSALEGAGRNGDDVAPAPGIPTFVDIGEVVAGQRDACVVEVQDPSRGHLTIRLRDASALSPVLEQLWSSRP